VAEHNACAGINPEGIGASRGEAVTAEPIEVRGVYSDLVARLIELGLCSDDGDTATGEFRLERLSVEGPDVDTDAATWRIHKAREVQDAWRSDPAPVERVDVLCGCGWGRLSASPDVLEELERFGCPICSRLFTVERGWAQ
jgi:hypothetical protein